MNQHRLSPVTYLIVDAVLIVFTILTVALSFVPGSGLTHLVSGLTIGLIKASLVVLFFMHAIHSPAQTRTVIAITIFWLVAVLLVLTFSDYITRGWIPFMPGH